MEAGYVLTLGSALAKAGASSPQAEAATQGIRAAEACRTLAGLRPNPSVSAQTENVVGTGPYRGFDQAETKVSFSMPLELGGKRGARVGVAEARIGRAELEAAIARADVRLRVTQAYIEAVAADRRLTIARAQLHIVNEALRVAKDRVVVGKSSPIDERRTSVAQIDAQTGLESAERAFQVARDNLGLLLGQSVTGALDHGWFDRVRTYGPDVRPTAGGTLAYAAARADLRVADANVRLARSQRVPDLTLNGGTRRSARPMPSAIRPKHGSVPPRLDAEQDIAIAQRDRDNAAASVHASGPALAAATEAARITRLGYGQGKFDQLILLDAERTLVETRNAAVDALAEYHDAEARLARLTAPAPASTGDNR